MSIKVTGWNDGRDAMRQRILNDVLDIMFKYLSRKVSPSHAMTNKINTLSNQIW